MYVRETLSAGVGVDYTEESDFFRLLGAPTDDVTVIFYKAGREEARAENIGAGYAETVPGGFDRVRITSTGGGVVKFVTRKGSEVRYDTPPNGLVTVTNTAGDFTQAQATVTNASGQLLAAKTNRRYLMVQNNDASADVYVTLDGTAATTAKGIKIAAGGSLELQGYLPTGQINAIGSVASNANVVTVEG